MAAVASGPNRLPGERVTTFTSGPGAPAFGLETLLSSVFMGFWLDANGQSRWRRLAGIWGSTCLPVGYLATPIFHAPGASTLGFVPCFVALWYVRRAVAELTPADREDIQARRLATLRSFFRRRGP